MNSKTIQEQFTKIKENKAFELFVISIIIISALMIGVKTYEIPQWATTSLIYLDWFITGFFLVELIIRYIATNNFLKFIKNGWNVFDSIIVAISLIPIEGSEMAMIGRLLRVFRVLRLISMIPELRILLAAFAKAIPKMGYIALLMFIVFYIYAAIGTTVFEEINPVLWGNISISMLTLFRVATFEDWTDVMYETMEIYPLSWAFYITFIFIIAFVFLNMMIGVVLETLQEEHDAHIKKDIKSTVDDNNDGIAKIMEKLKELEAKIDKKTQ